MLKLIPLGGLGEIGLNMMVIEYGKTSFIVDAGLMFPETYMLGVDYVIPKMDYLRINKTRVKGIILTHAHEDHIGAIPFFLKEFNVPVFATAFTLEIIRHKLKELFLSKNNLLYEISSRKKININPFEIEFINVNHSVVDSVGLAIRTPIGNIIHTGDFKIGHKGKRLNKANIATFAKYGNQNLIALLSDSTNVEKEGYNISSEELSNKLMKIVEKAKGRIFVTLFASNIERIQQLINIAKIKCRKVIFNGRSLQTNLIAAIKLGYINIPKNMQININDIMLFPDRKIMLITTGSQGEPMSALSRMASGKHKQINIKKGDIVILSSKFIPGNEKAIGNTINNLYKRGATVIHEKITMTHISGHAFKEELKLVIKLTNPKFFLPIHGEYRHLLLHSQLANKCGISKNRIMLAQNGDVIELTKNNFNISKKVISGRTFIDGKGIGDIEKSVLKERQILSEEGLVVVNITFDEKTGIILYGPELISKGFIFENKTGYLLKDAECIILEVIEEFRSKETNSIDLLKSKIQLSLRQYFFYTIGRRPIILLFFIKI